MANPMHYRLKKDINKRLANKNPKTATTKNAMPVCVRNHVLKKKQTLSSANQVLWQKGPNSADDTKDGKNDNQDPRNDSFREWDILPVEFKVEGDGQDDGDESAEGSAQEGTDGVERWKNDGDEEQDQDDGDADDCSEEAGEEGLWRGVRVDVEVADDVDGGDEGSGGEGDLGEGDDGDAGAHDEGEGFGVA